ncbi:MAG: sugar phosphate nucleotidyltransferase [Candidatus Dormibacteraeota bacterium]|nr:sugar phosphate nucleotidyltransferase [Candidatus Dormibacteraeota bacterium]
MPKALMPVAGLPVVEQVMRIYASQGFDEFVLAVGYLKEDLLTYFRHRTDWNVECVDTGDISDTGTRVRLCLEHVGAEFHATYCDGLGNVDLRSLVEFHSRHGDGATMTAAPLRSQYGILQSDSDDRITQFLEKPVLPQYWINAGFFVFDREIFAKIEGENLERDILPKLAARRHLRVFRHRGFWRSMDTQKDQQELDVLWQPFSQDLDDRTPAGGAGVPQWLHTRYALIAKETA